MRRIIVFVAALAAVFVLAVPAFAQTSPGLYGGEEVDPNPPAAPDQPAAQDPTPSTDLPATGLGLTAGMVLGVGLLVVGGTVLVLGRRRDSETVAS